MDSGIINDRNCTPIISIATKTDTKSNTEFLHSQYNWVDAKLHAEKIFWDYSCELPWAEDMWNILMFNDIVISKNIMSTSHNDNENGDIILWLLAMYDLYFRYKVQLTLDFENGRVGFLEISDNITDSSSYLAEYFQEKTNDCIGLSIDKNETSLDNAKENNTMEVEPIREELEDILYEEVRVRKEIVKKRMYDYFKNEDHMIVYFMQGAHWYDNYLNINGCIDDAEVRVMDKFEKISALISEGYIVRYIDSENDHLFEDLNDVEYVMESEVEEFKKLYRKSVNDFDTQLIYDWVVGGMN